MRRDLYTYGLIAGVIAGVLLAPGCTSETNQSAVTATSLRPTEAAELVRSAIATSQSATENRSATDTPESSVAAGQPVHQGSPEDESANTSVTPALRSQHTDAADAAGVEYLELEGAQTASFSVNSSNTALPEDILQEINWFGGAGGGGDPCEEQRGEPFIYGEGSAPSEPLDVISIGTCGWLPDEVVSVTLTKPDGVVISELGDRLWYELTLDDPLGEYELVFRGGSGELRATVTVALPDGPRLYIREDELILYNFEPGENIRLFAYQGSTNIPPANFKAWSSFQTDRRGELILELDSASMPDTYTYVVVGEKSGEVFPYSYYTTSNDTVLPTVAIERGGPYLTISGVYIHRPGTFELERSMSLWSFNPYRDLAAPGTNAYNVHLTNQGDQVLWRFSWCAKNEETLQQILAPLSLRFLINHTVVPMYMFVQHDEPSSGGWACRWWSTSINYWPEDTVSELAIEYDLATAINDGATSYPAGSYRHIIRVSLDQ